MTISKSWVTPITIGAFILMAVTGLLMFFEIETGYNKRAHEWFSLIFVAGALFHIWTSKNSFLYYFKTWKGIAFISFFVVVLALSFLSPPKEQNGRIPVQKVIGKLNSKPINDLALLSGANRDSLLIQLNQAGFKVSDGSETVQDLAKGERGNEAKIYSLIFK
ncbi:MAG: DUF4405 domain-containing protein [Bacteroidetes bacterium]|nr:DUF4405 domain-containing protein [Bacteroidota bacterium]